MKTPFVPHGTKSICTYGLNPMGSEIVVSKANNSSARLMGGKLMATEMDKPMNFACKWAGMATALLIALFAAMPFLFGLLVAMVVGVAASFTIGNAMCYIFTMNAPWSSLHPSVKIEGKKTLTANSKMQCTIGGSIQIFFSPEVAGAEARKNATKNFFSIFMSYVGGKSASGLFKMGKSLFAVNKASAIIGPAVTVVVGYCINEVLAPYMDKVSDIASDLIVDGTNEDVKNIEIERWVSLGKSERLINSTNKAFTDSRVSNKRILGDDNLRTKEVKVSRDYGTQTKSITMTEAHSNTNKAIAAGDKRPYSEVFQENLTKEHTSKKALADKHAQLKLQRMSRKERSKIFKRQGKSYLKGFFGYVDFANILFNTAYKVQEKKLAKWGDNEEAIARAKVKVTEKEV